MRVHDSITEERVLEAVERTMWDLDMPGFCKACGADVGNIEPDADDVECDQCGSPSVIGAEQLLLELVA